MTQFEVDAADRRSFFQTPAFWTGSLLWLMVFAAGVMVWNRKHRERSELVAGERGNQVAVAVAAEANAQNSSSPTTAADQATGTNASDATKATESDDSGSPPRQIKITTDKNGNAKVVRPGENPESPWDKDGIADFELTDTAGEKFTKQSLLGKPWIVCFVFTHCAATCPAVTLSMRELQDHLKKYDFRLVTMTVDPVRDTSEVLREYGKSRGADFNKWSFVTGDQRDIYRLIHGSFKMPVQELVGEKRQLGFEFIHSNNIMLVDDKGVVQGKFDATKGPAMADLRRAIQKLAKPVAFETKTGTE